MVRERLGYQIKHMLHVTNVKILKAMAKKGLIGDYPVMTNNSTGKCFTYVQENENGDTSFIYCGVKYKLKYHDGCFYPFVHSGD